MLLSPVVIVTVLALVASVVAARSLIGAGVLAAPALLPAHDQLSSRCGRRCWPRFPVRRTRSARRGWRWPPLGSTVLAGQPEWFSTLLLCGVVPMAFLAAIR